MEQTTPQIDIDALFKKKNPGLYRWIPGFVLRWIKKTLHQDDMNGALMRNKDLRDAEFAEQIVSVELGAKLSSTGRDNIPKTGGAIVVANHPLGGVDGMMLMVEASRVRKDVRVIVNDVLTALPNFGEIFIPVNKLGTKAKESLQKVEEAYATGKLVLVFPAGLCSRKRNGIVRDLEWQKSFVSRALKYQLPVIPTYISGENTNRFYRIANIRKALGIKINIEMFFLPDEMFRQKGKLVNINFGKPLPPETFDHSRSQHEWAQLLKEFVYASAADPSLEFPAFAEIQKTGKH